MAGNIKVNQKLVISILNKRGHDVIVAGTGKEALGLLETETFDLILMDIQMPVMDGLEATRKIRIKERGTGEHVPIVAMTAYAMKVDLERCLKTGMDSVITKPIRQTEFITTVENIANNSV